MCKLLNFLFIPYLNFKALLNDNSITVNDLPNDTEAAIRYITSLLPATIKETLKYPRIVFINQLYDVIRNKTLINRELVGK